MNYNILYFKKHRASEIKNQNKWNLQIKIQITSIPDNSTVIDNDSRCCLPIGTRQTGPSINRFDFVLLWSHLVNLVVSASMLSAVQENVPEMVMQRSRMAFCGHLHLGRPRDRSNFGSTLVLGRNLKFYEFRRKELVHQIDLRGTKLQEVASQLEGYDGPMCPFLINPEARDRLESSMLQKKLHYLQPGLRNI